MKNALVIGSTGGIGRAICAALEKRGVAVATLSRKEDGFDITDPDSISHHMSALNGPFDLIFVATGALVIDGVGPEKSVKAVTAKGMAAQFAVNAIGPALVLGQVARLLPKKTASKIGILSARVGSIGDNSLGGWTSYRAAKAALNQVIKTTSIELARTHPQATCVALHPGTVATPFTRDYLGRHPSVSPEDAAQNLLDVLDSVREKDTGGFFDYSGVPVSW